jgi:DUF4097 and DUF4098 domain-containing protein YvlB
MSTKALWVLVTVGCLATASLSRAAAESNLKKSFPFKPGGQLVVNADQGAIEVVTTDAGSVEIEVRRKLHGVDDAKANQIFAAHEVTFDQDGDRVEVRGKFKEDSKHWFKRGVNLDLLYHISVPKQFNLDLTTGSGSISSSAIEGKVRARSAGGSLKFGDINGALDAQTGSGSITAGNVTGAVSVKTSGGSIQLGQMAAETTAETGSGSISVAAAQAGLSARTHGGSLKLGELAGPATVETGSGSIQVKTAKASLKARTAGGSVEVGGVEGPAELESGSGSIQVDSAKQTLKATTRGGSLELGQLFAPAEVSTGSGPIRVKSAQARLVARTSGGSIGIDDARDTVIADSGSGTVFASFSAQPSDDSNLSTRGGNIEVRLPENLALEVDASTSGGRVSTELPITSTIVGEHKPESLKGKLNGGGKLLVLKTGSGNVTIKKR